MQEQKPRSFVSITIDQKISFSTAELQEDVPDTDTVEEMDTTEYTIVWKYFAKEKLNKFFQRDIPNAAKEEQFQFQ